MLVCLCVGIADEEPQDGSRDNSWPDFILLRTLWMALPADCGQMDSRK